MNRIAANVALLLFGCIAAGLLIGHLGSKSRLPAAPVGDNRRAAVVESAKAVDSASTSSAGTFSTSGVPPTASRRAAPPAQNPPAPQTAAALASAVPVPQSDDEAADLARKENLQLRAPQFPLFSYAYEHARNGDLETMQKILDVHPEFITNTVGSYQATLLHNAAYRGQREIVADLLNRNPNLNALTAQGHTPLFDAVDGGNREVVQLLLEHGADMNIPNANGITPAQFAVQRDRPDIALLLKNWAAKQ